MIIANIPGSCPTEQVGQEAAPPAKVTISTERKMTEDMLGEPVEDRADVAVEPNKSSKRKYFNPLNGLFPVIPAQAGIQGGPRDSGFLLSRNDIFAKCFI